MYKEMKSKENIIKVKAIGVGGGGNNAINRMILDNVKNVEFYLLNTEQGILKRAATKNVLQIGKETTKGLGAGANAEVGERAARENKEDIRKILEGVDLLFVTCRNGRGNRNWCSSSSC